MPSVTMVLQAICSFGIFSTSTRHMRQLPSTERSGCQQKCGMWIPICSAALITLVPGATSTSRPSMVHLGMRLPVELPGDDVQAADRRDGVREQRALDHLGERLGHREARRVALHAPWELAPVAHDVEGLLAVRALVVAVDLADRRQDAVVDELEVVHQRLD